MDRKTKGILCIMLSALCFSFMNMFVRLSGDLPTMQKCFFRNAIAFVIAFYFLMKDKSGFHIEKTSLKHLFLRATGGTIGLISNFYAVDHLSQSDASMLNKMSPFFAIVFSYFLLKEKLKAWQITAVVIAFIGSMFVVKPTFSNMDLFPSVIGFIGGVGAGFAYTQVRIMGERGVKSSLIVAFFSAFSTLVVLPMFIINFHAMTGKQVIVLIAAGVAAAGGQFGITKAYTYAAAREVSVYDYTQIIFSTMIGIVVFDQLPDRWSFLGYFLIIFAAVFVFLFNNGKLSFLERRR